MSELLERINKFVAYSRSLTGDEKGEAQVFCDRLFQAFGHEGYKEAGATLEFRIKKGTGTSFADLVWKPRLLLEMKKRGEKLELHYQQAFDYWINAVPNRPRYVVLCNFDEFWVYDFDRQLHEPIDEVKLAELPNRYTALNFFFSHNPKPLFGNDREAVSIRAADKVAELFRLLTRGFRPNIKTKQTVSRTQAQRFIVQTVVAMFAEDIDLLPQGTIKSIVDDCLETGASSYDLFGALFRQMNTETAAKAGRYQGVRYFNGGLFSTIEPIEMNRQELETLGGEHGAALENWSKVNPAIFGTLFQHSMDKKERHKFGAHYTSEADIERVVGPTIVRPWISKVDDAKNADEVLKLREQLSRYRVLDPACGSGNFLYMAYRELARIETRLLVRLHEELGPKQFAQKVKVDHSVSPKQFFGIELDPFGAELAKVTLMLAKKLAIDEANVTFDRERMAVARQTDDSLPLDNLDKNIWNKDALFCDWPEAEAIIGNPPYQSKNKIQQEFGPEYVHRLREKHPDVGGRADYCVYWFRLAHDRLKGGQRAGLVGTNTIRQNYSREGGLDHIVDSGGTITDAVSSMIWSGEAVVHVSVVNWIKGKGTGKKRLYLQTGNIADEGWTYQDLERIGPSLSFGTDVTHAMRLTVNAERGGCYQGQTHGHEGFLLLPAAAKTLIKKDANYKKVIFPFLTADDLVGQTDAKPTRYVIDFHPRDLIECKEFPEALAQIESTVLPDRKKAAKKEDERNKPLLEADPESVA